MVTVYRGHHQTLFFLPGIISLFIMCIGLSEIILWEADAPKLRFEHRLLSTSCCIYTAYGAGVL